MSLECCSWQRSEGFGRFIFLFFKELINDAAYLGGGADEEQLRAGLKLPSKLPLCPWQAESEM